MINLKRYEEVTTTQLWTYKGRVTRVVGMSIESLGPMAHIGDICYIQPKGKKELVTAEVVGFKDEHLLLMPLGNLEGIGPGCEVLAYGDKLSIKVDESLLGKVVDWQAKPIDKKEIFCTHQVPIDNTAPNPLTRNRIASPLELGVRAIDGMLTV